MELYEEQMARETIFEGAVFSIYHDEVKLPDNTIGMREIVAHSGGVAVVALDAADNLLLVRQYRYAASKVLLELPAGKIEQGEDPKTCGMRELEEETGFVAKDVSYLGEFWVSPGYCSEKIYLYLAKGLTATAQKLDPGEFVRIETLPLAEAYAMCADGRIQDGKTLVGLSLYRNMTK